MSVEGIERPALELAWTTSSYSSEEGGQCVEVAAGPGAVYVRDSKDKAGPALTFAPAAWAAFVDFAADQDV